MPDDLASLGALGTNFLFQIKWDGQLVAGVSRVGPLRRVTGVVTHREGYELNHVRHSPATTHFDPVILERGVTLDRDFERWSNKVFVYGSGAGAELSLKDFRKDLALELLNEDTAVVARFLLYRCWPSEFVQLPALDSATGGAVFQRLVLTIEGWERDLSVVPPPPRLKAPHLPRTDVLVAKPPTGLGPGGTK